MLLGMLQVSPTRKAKRLEVFGTERFLFTGQAMTGSYCQSSSSRCASPAPGDSVVSRFVAGVVRRRLPREARQRVALDWMSS